MPQWRALVAEVLDAARRSTRDAAVTLASVLDLLEAGEGPALAEVTAADRGLARGTDPAYAAWSEKFASRVLTASIGIAAIDSRTFHPTWSWPEGARLDAEDGWKLPLESVVAEVLAMVRDGEGWNGPTPSCARRWSSSGSTSTNRSGSTTTSARRPERPIGSFAARHGLSRELVVLTDRSLHLFRDPQGPRLAGLVNPVDPRAAGSSCANGCSRSGRATPPTRCWPSTLTTYDGPGSAPRSAGCGGG